MHAHHELTESGVTTRDASTLTGIARCTATRDKARPTAVVPAVTTAGRVPENKLTEAERRGVLDVLCSARFVDRSPLEVYAQLLDEGIYLCSVSTMYRILWENAQVKERRRQARHPSRACPELVATAPRQVYSWDITKLPGPVKGTYFDAYVMIDIFSRYIVGAHVQTHESGLLAAEMMTEIFTVHGIPNVVHADRGTSMTSKAVATLLADLEVTRSHSRPRVSNDNPYSSITVQDPQVRADVAGALRLDSPCTKCPGRVHLVVQPRTSPYRDRDAHTGGCALRSCRTEGHRTRRRARSGTGAASRALRDGRHPKDPGPTHRRLDQQALGRTRCRSGRRVTPVGLNRLDTFRLRERRSELS